MIEGSGSRAGSGSIPSTSGSGSGRPKNTWIRWIRIRNTTWKGPTASAGGENGLFDFTMDQISIKTTNPKCRLYWCLIELKDGRYSQSCWYFRPLLWTSAPLTFSLVHLIPPPVWIINTYPGCARQLRKLNVAFFSPIPHNSGPGSGSGSLPEDYSVVDASFFCLRYLSSIIICVIYSCSFPRASKKNFKM